VRPPQDHKVAYYHFIDENKIVIITNGIINLWKKNIADSLGITDN